MSDQPSNYELEELLSAYLDGELSADERAAVEARLATDPAAQQLLHELRSVSQSVQRLPTESLGRDLSEEIIRRAREVKPAHGITASAKTLAPNEASRLPGPMPGIRIFSSKRSWIWASVALAAGLLLMIVQSGDDPANKLPPVAARNREGVQVQLADEAGQPARREIAISAVPETPPATVAFNNEVHEKVDALGTTMPAAPTSGQPSGDQLSSIGRDGTAAGLPVAGARPAPNLRKAEEKTVLEAGDASSTSAARPSQVAADKPMTPPQPTGRVSGSAGALGIAAGKQKSEPSLNPNAQRFIVVRVVAKLDALKNGSFERLLADNKIEFLPQLAKNQPLAFGGGKFAKPAQSEIASNEPSNKAAEIHAETEMFLVEAPLPTIESCLADLNKNSNEFLSIAVNEVAKSHDRLSGASTPAKKLVENRTNLNRFSRGTSPAQKDISGLYDFYKYDFKKLTDPVVNGSTSSSSDGAKTGIISGVERDANVSKLSVDKSQPAADIRRARRIDPLDIADGRSGEPRSETRAARTQEVAEPAKQPMSQRIPVGGAQAIADRNGVDLKVLFVVTPAETPASSSPPDNRPE